MASTTYIKGQWNCICDRCGLEYKSAQLREEWTGLMVCKACWEPRHPQTLIQEPRPESTIPWSRPEAAEVSIDPYILTETEIAIHTELDFPLNRE